MAVSLFGMLEDLDDHCLNALIPKGLKNSGSFLIPIFLNGPLASNSTIKEFSLLTVWLLLESKTL